MSITRSEADHLLTAIDAMCESAGQIHLKHFRKLDGYEKKGAVDLLTVADRESEEVIKSMIAERFPGHAILAEESGACGETSSDYLWVIDPIDGTTNYAHGLPLFSVSIALQHNGQTIAGGISAPALGDHYRGALGHGATHNGKPMHVSKVDVLQDALLVTGFPYNRSAVLDWLTETLGRFLDRSQGMLRLGSAALDFAHVASGHIDGFYELNLHPWDMAAGALFVQEAGGRVSDFGGSEFSIFNKQMLCSNGTIHQAMVDVIAETNVPEV